MFFAAAMECDGDYGCDGLDDEEEEDMLGAVTSYDGASRELVVTRWTGRTITGKLRAASGRQRGLRRRRRLSCQPDRGLCQIAIVLERCDVRVAFG